MGEGSAGGVPGAAGPPLRRLPFAEVRARLAALPAELPEPPAALLPVRTDTGEMRPRTPLDPARVRPAAVLVLLYPDEAGETRVVLTERVDRGGHHAGEVSFPGGSAESGEASEQTALREAAEEVGLDAAAAGVAVLGVLPSFWIPVSGFLVSPVVAVAPRRPTMLASPDEVVRIVEPPLAAFLPEAPIETVEREVRGWSLRYGAYPVEDLRVWGATARVLGQLGALLGA
ncbi:MAG TPA: CoA pyrophosphatase [Candidatus Limnocylindrales bacterium]